MEIVVKEIYSKEGKKLFEFIQEWIDENSSFLCNCQIEENSVNYHCR